MRRKISEIMGGYLHEKNVVEFDFLPPLQEAHAARYNEVPITPSISEWVVSACGKKLQQEFVFLNIKSRNAFVLDIMDLEKTSGHHIDFNVSGFNVFINLQTKDLEMITNLDVECSKHITNCAVDIRQSRL